MNQLVNKIFYSKILQRKKKEKFQKLKVPLKFRMNQYKMIKDQLKKKIQTLLQPLKFVSQNLNQIKNSLTTLKKLNIGWRM